MKSKNLDWFVRKKQIYKDLSVKKLSNNYMKKARNNLITMSLLFSLYSNKEAVDVLTVPDDYDPGEWVVTCGYYAMYMAAMSALAKIDYKSKNHSATVLALEKFFVKKKKLESKYLKMLKDAKLEKEDIELLKGAKTKRQIAQYSVTKKTTKDLASTVKEDAYKFVERIEKLLEEID